MTKSQAIDKINIRKEEIHKEIKIARQQNDSEKLDELINRLDEIQEIINLFK